MRPGIKRGLVVVAKVSALVVLVAAAWAGGMRWQEHCSNLYDYAMLSGTSGMVGSEFSAKDTSVTVYADTLTWEEDPGGLSATAWVDVSVPGFLGGKPFPSMVAYQSHESSESSGGIAAAGMYSVFSNYAVDTGEGTAVFYEGLSRDDRGIGSGEYFESRAAAAEWVGEFAKESERHRANVTVLGGSGGRVLAAWFLADGYPDSLRGEDRDLIADMEGGRSLPAIFLNPFLESESME